jgi:ribonuclease HI
MNGYAQLWTDGACNNNTPNGMGLGIVLSTEAETYQYAARCETYSRKATSNIAEYTALLYGLDLAIKSHHCIGVLIRCDSEVLVKGITHEYTLKDPLLIELRDAIQSRLGSLVFWSIEWIPRKQNKPADKLSKLGLTCDLSTLEQQKITL